jgi:hypothetical protein
MMQTLDNISLQDLCAAAEEAAVRREGRERFDFTI